VVITLWSSTPSRAVRDPKNPARCLALVPCHTLPMRSGPRDLHAAAETRPPTARRSSPSRFATLAAALLVYVVGCAEPAPVAKTVVIPVDGMVCDACAKSIDAEVEKVAGVDACDITFEAGAATVRYDANKTDPAAIAAAIDKLGYHAGEPKPAS
jgi:copper chaperone CopZ